MEFDEENRSTGGAIARAKREIRDEARARRAEREVGGAEGKELNGVKAEAKARRS